ncbi:MAG: DUF2935 domain-containing protein [Eubacterium sp.]
MEDYVVKSLELHLFFGRIMKEHALFLKAGFTPADSSFAEKAEFYKNAFEKLLLRTLRLSNGIIGCDVLKSGELVTEFTALAERQTENFTGININREITDREQRLKCGCNITADREMCRQVRMLNRNALQLLDGLIAFKERILKNVLSCNMFTLNYPLLIEHIIREAKLYRKYIMTLEESGNLSDDTMAQTECFWNRIMMEHAMFIRGLIDPAESELFNSADTFACEYADLLKACDEAQRETVQSASLQETIKLRDFKTAGVRGIEQCKIRSIILPLLADHVLREANHYIRLLS